MWRIEQTEIGRIVVPPSLPDGFGIFYTTVDFDGRLNAEAELFVDHSGVKPHIDLPRLTAALLTERGIAPQNIHDSGLCTRCDGSIFHSYRRDAGRGGRNLAIAAH